MTEKERKEIEDNMVEVEGGVFMMGAQKEDNKKPNYDKEAYDSEAPVHEVKLDSFKISRYPVTQAQWKAVMDDNPSYFQSDKLPAGVDGDDLPVENVSWDEVRKFLTKLNDLLKLDPKKDKIYRLPTEAEWEYACRGGACSAHYKYSGNNDIDEVAWYGKNSDKRTHEVGTKLPNELGLYDMSGNVWEWCQDDWSDNYKAPKNSSDRVLRGGSWRNVAENCRVSFRNYHTPDTRNNYSGFRLALPQ